MADTRLLLTTLQRLSRPLDLLGLIITLLELHLEQQTIMRNTSSFLVFVCKSGADTAPNASE